MSDPGHTRTPRSNPEPKSPRGADRRKKPTNPLSLYSLLYGRRRKPRRGEDRAAHYYVDRYGPVSVTLFLLALALSTADALITIHLLERGASELNPVMHFLLQMGETTFLAVKFGATFLALLFLLVHKEYDLFGRRLRGKHLLAFALWVYALLILWELVLLLRI